MHIGNDIEKLLAYHLGPRVVQCHKFNANGVECQVNWIRELVKSPVKTNWIKVRLWSDTVNNSHKLVDKFHVVAEIRRPIGKLVVWTEIVTLMFKGTWKK